MSDFSDINVYLQKLERRIPVVPDKALIDLVNGIEVNKDVIRYRQGRGFWGRLVNTLDGSDFKRKILLDRNLIVGQESLFQWVLELTDSLRISDVALAVTQEKLLATRDAVRRQQENLDKHGQAIEYLLNKFKEFAEQVDIQFQEHQRRIHKLEAYQDLESKVEKWEAEQTYQNLPWLAQVTLLVREVFSSSVTIFERKTGDKQLREQLTNKIIKSRFSQEIPNSPKSFSLADYLDSSWANIPNNDRELLTGLLEVRFVSQQRVWNTPMLFAIGTSLELATLPAEDRPDKPAKCALALCRTQINPLFSRTTDRRSLVETVVEETANDCLAMMPLFN